MTEAPDDDRRTSAHRAAHARPNVVVVIPALDEEESLPMVLDDIARDVVDDVIVCDNGSSDATAEVAARSGARVVKEIRRGYGSACLRALEHLSPDAEIVVFLDADYSDDPREIDRLIAPIADGRLDLVIGSRVRRARPNALSSHQRFGNWLATGLIRLFFGHRFTDLGPFRAIRRSSLADLGMRDPAMGWTVEMQIKAVRAGLRVGEIDVDYRPRIGRSKISGTLLGSVRAGAKILFLVLRYGLAPAGSHRAPSAP